MNLKDNSHKPVDSFSQVAAVVLAAGKGTRIGQKLPKALYPIAGKPMLHYTIDTLKRISIKDIKVVIGYRAIDVKASIGKRVDYVYQSEQKGTAHAVLQAMQVIQPTATAVLVINCDDSAFYEPSTLRHFIQMHQSNNNPVSMISLDIADPTGLGRLVRDKKGNLTGIVEEKDATPKERKINEINAGCYLFDTSWLSAHISSIKPSPVTGEHYLTDVVGLALSQDQKVSVYKLPNPSEFKQVNTKQELSKAHDSMVAKLKTMCLPRVTLIDLDNTLLNTDILKKDFIDLLYNQLTKTFGIDQEKSNIAKIYQREYEAVRETQGFVDIPMISQNIASSLSIQNPETVESVFLTSPFKKYLFPESTELVEFLRRWSRLVLFADGDMIYEPVKVSTLDFQSYYHDLYVAEKKSDLFFDIDKIYKSSSMLYIDDQVRNLEYMKEFRSDTQTIWIRQGAYAEVKPKSSKFKPNFTVNNLTDLMDLMKTQIYNWT